jgi:hypothetical protein
MQCNERLQVGPSQFQSRGKPCCMNVGAKSLRTRKLQSDPEYIQQAQAWQKVSDLSRQLVARRVSGESTKQARRSSGPHYLHHCLKQPRWRDPGPWVNGSGFFLRILPFLAMRHCLHGRVSFQPGAVALFAGHPFPWLHKMHGRAAEKASSSLRLCKEQSLARLQGTGLLLARSVLYCGGPRRRDKSPVNF